MVRRLIIVLLLALFLCQSAMPTSARRSELRGLLIIPSIRLVVPVHTASLVDGGYVMPARGVVWLEGTAWIDMDWARVVLAGHTPGTLARLAELRAEDRIFIYGQQGSVAYQITGLHLTMPDDTSWLMPTNAPTLAIITCRGSFRLVVAAERLG